MRAVLLTSATATGLNGRRCEKPVVELFCFGNAAKPLLAAIRVLTP
jgi:hypothetical protein